MVTALILSGGTGVRLGGNIPKQYIEVNGRPIIAWCLETFRNHPQVDRIRIVAAPEWREYLRGVIDAESAGSNGGGRRNGITEKFEGFSDPGQTRQLSIMSGLKDMASDTASADDIVIIHDAARPLVSSELISNLIAAAREHEGALPYLPMKDTVYYSTNGKVIESLIDRGCLYAGQAPEAFRFRRYYDACFSLSEEQVMKINGSTEPAVMAGMDIAMIPGDEKNFKITTQADMERFLQLV